MIGGVDSFGQYIRRERERQELSLERAAAKTGISKSRLRELETGLSLKTRKPTKPTAENVAALARGLGLDQDQLAGLAGLGYRVNPASQEELALLAVFRSLPPTHRSLALGLLEALRDHGDQEPLTRNRAAERPGSWSEN